jgi:hypothetical protein
MVEGHALPLIKQNIRPPWLRELLLTLSPSIGAERRLQSTFRTTIHEENAGALSLANLEPGQSTPRSKHYAGKLQWFRSKLDPDGPRGQDCNGNSKSGYLDQRFIKNSVPNSSETTL